MALKSHGEERMDNQVTEAIYSGGVLKPPGKVSLHEAERVRLIIERTESARKADDWHSSGCAPGSPLCTSVHPAHCPAAMISMTAIDIPDRWFSARDIRPKDCEGNGGPAGIREYLPVKTC